MTVRELVNKCRFEIGGVLLTQNNEQIVCCEPEQLNKFEANLKVVSWCWCTAVDWYTGKEYWRLDIEVKE